MRRALCISHHAAQPFSYVQGYFLLCTVNLVLRKQQLGCAHVCSLSIIIQYERNHDTVIQYCLRLAIEVCFALEKWCRHVISLIFDMVYLIIHDFTTARVKLIVKINRSWIPSKCASRYYLDLLFNPTLTHAWILENVCVSSLNSERL